MCVREITRKWKAGIVGGMNEQELINSFAGELERGVRVRMCVFICVCLRVVACIIAYTQNMKIRLLQYANEICS